MKDKVIIGDGIKEKLKKIEEAKYKIDSTLNVSNVEIKNNNKLINKHIDVLNLICEDCKLDVEKTLSLDVAKNSIEKHTECINKYTEIQKQLEKEEAKLIKVNKDLENIKLHVMTNDKLIEKNKGVIDHLYKDITDLGKRVKEEKEKKSPFNEIINKYKKDLEENVKVLKNNYKIKKFYQIIELSLSDDGAKKYIIQDLIDVLNNSIKKYLNETGASYTAIFDSSFNCEFITDTGICSYENFSSGEKGRIDIAILFSFRDILSKLGTINSSILVLDELLDKNGLDKYAINALMKIVKNLIKSTNQTIFIVSHSGVLDLDDFDNVIEIEKKGGFTRIINDKQGELQ